jgi:hypothetical protein
MLLTAAVAFLAGMVVGFAVAAIALFVWVWSA